MPSTLSHKGTTFCNKTEERLPSNSAKKKPGYNAPPSTRYNVKRLFEPGCEGVPEQIRSPERCTFGESHEKYRHVVVGSRKFLGLKRYERGDQKLSVICDQLKHKSPGAIYNLSSSLNSRDYNLKSSALPDNFFYSRTPEKRVFEKS